MKIYVNYTTVNTTDRTVVQVSVLYDIRRKVQEPKRPRAKKGQDLMCFTEIWWDLVSTKTSGLRTIGDRCYRHHENICKLYDREYNQLYYSTS